MRFTRSSGSRGSKATAKDLLQVDITVYPHSVSKAAPPHAGRQVGGVLQVAAGSETSRAVPADLQSATLEEETGRKEKEEGGSFGSSGNLETASPAGQSREGVGSECPECAAEPCLPVLG